MCRSREEAVVPRRKKGCRTVGVEGREKKSRRDQKKSKKNRVEEDPETSE